MASPGMIRVAWAGWMVGFGIAAAAGSEDDLHPAKCVSLYPQITPNPNMSRQIGLATLINSDVTIDRAAATQSSFGAEWG